MDNTDGNVLVKKQSNRNCASVPRHHCSLCLGMFCSSFLRLGVQLSPDKVTRCVTPRAGSGTVLPAGTGSMLGKGRGTVMCLQETSPCASTTHLCHVLLAQGDPFPSSSCTSPGIPQSLPLLLLPSQPLDICRPS